MGVPADLERRDDESFRESAVRPNAQPIAEFKPLFEATIEPGFMVNRNHSWLSRPANP